MPQITVRGIDQMQAAQISRSLIPTMAQYLKIDIDEFTFDLLMAQSFFEGAVVQTFPFVSIGWFDRGQDAKDRVAAMVTDCFNEAGVEQLEIHFNTFKRADYYANAERY